MLTEINVDAVVGPTHHFGGLGVGNVASLQHEHLPSHPRAAALEGLAKAEYVAHQGIPQFLWLPPLRPRLDLLSQLGFDGSLKVQLTRAATQAPEALSAAFSSAFMWAANACTVTAASDSQDGKYHFSPANLLSSWHRGLEAVERKLDISRLLGQDSRTVVHDALPSIFPLRDEGAANHMRLCDPSGRNAINVFVHGSEGHHESSASRFMPRHTRSTSAAICRRHALSEEDSFLLRQHPRAIAVGVFHNDVIATSHENLLLHHEYAFIDAEEELQRLEAVFVRKAGQALVRIEISEHELSLTDAVASYFFNSQIISPARREGSQTPRMLIVCPQQCRQITRARTMVERIVADSDNPIEAVQYVSLQESMAGGGGPACLRLRIPADELLLANMNSRLRVNTRLLDQLRRIIESAYPERVTFSDLSEPEFTAVVFRAHYELAKLIS